MQEGMLRLHRVREGGERIESPRAYLSTVVSRSRSTSSARHGFGARPTWAIGCRSRSWRAPTTIPPAGPRWRTRCRSPSSFCSRACRPSSAPRSCSTRCSTSPTIGSPSILGTSEPNARQLVTRARRHVQERRPRVRRLARAAGAARDPLLRGRPGRAISKASSTLLAHDVVLRADGGGKAPAVKRALHGRATVARALIAGLRAGSSRRRFHPAPRGGQRPTGCAVPRPRGQAGRA